MWFAYTLSLSFFQLQTNVWNKFRIIWVYEFDNSQRRSFLCHISSLRNLLLQPLFPPSDKSSVFSCNGGRLLVHYGAWLSLVHVKALYTIKALTNRVLVCALVIWRSSSCHRNAEIFTNFAHNWRFADVQHISVPVTAPLLISNVCLTANVHRRKLSRIHFYTVQKHCIHMYTHISHFIMKCICVKSSFSTTLSLHLRFQHHGQRWQL